MSEQFNIKEHIKSLRPTLGESSLKTYSSILSALFKKANGDKPFNIEWFRHVDNVLDAIADKTIQSRRATLSAVIVLLNNEGTEKYSELMKAANTEIKKDYESQKMTEKQAENWMTFEEVKSNWDKEYARVKPLLNSKTELTNNELWELSKFMMLTLTSGIFFPPRRSEWITLKLKPTDKSVDNWIDMKANEFVWNTYKTSQTYGRQRVEFPKEFKAILNKYIKRIGPQERLIFDTAGEEIKKPAFTQALNRMYGKNISTSMLRHIYLSHIHRDTPSINTLNKIAQDMGHSVSTGMEYAKKA
jgi:integrase